MTNKPAAVELDMVDDTETPSTSTVPDPHNIDAIWEPSPLTEEEKAYNKALNEQSPTLTDYDPEGARLSEEVEAAKTKPGVPPPGTPEVKKDPILIASAVNLGIPSDEIESMSGAELQRVVRVAEKAASAVYEAMAKKTPPAETPKPEDEFEARIKQLQADGYDPVFIDTLRESHNLKKRNEELLERVKKLEDSPRAAEQNAVETRVRTVVDTLGLADSFDQAKGGRPLRSLIAAAAKIVELDIEAGKTPTLKDEPDILRRAALALGLSPRDNKAAITKEKERFANGSLAKPRQQERGDSVIGAVRKIISQTRPAGAEEPAETVDWL